MRNKEERWVWLLVRLAAASLCFITCCCVKFGLCCAYLGLSFQNLGGRLMCLGSGSGWLVGDSGIWGCGG
jgi:hypothetical protein